MRVGFGRPPPPPSYGSLGLIKNNQLCTFWDDIGSTGSTYTLTCTGKIRTSPVLSSYLSEPILGRFVTLQKVFIDGDDLNWAEVRVESTSGTAELEQEETVGVFLDSAIM